MNIKHLVPLLIHLVSSVLSNSHAQPKEFRNTELTGGLWYNGRDFQPATWYSVAGTLSSRRPDRVDTVIRLNGLYMLPPFGEAHNHNLGTGVPEWDQRAVDEYVRHGVFYVKIPGSLALTDAEKKRLGINSPQGPDMLFSLGSITAPRGHPIPLMEMLLTRGFFPGHTRQSLENVRYFTLEQPLDLEKKWPLILASKPDFIKVCISRSDEYERFKNDSTTWYRGLNPDLLPAIIQKAHQNRLPVTAHIINAFDFHLALKHGVDEIAHLPRFISGVPFKAIAPEDARLAASKKIPLITTYAISLFQGGAVKPEDIPLAKQAQQQNLRILKDAGALVIIGSDNPADYSGKEIMYLRDLGVYSDAELLQMWCEQTPAAIFPHRKIGRFQEGYEASFIALEVNPLQDFQQVHRIRLRFKQGYLLPSN